jgi:hypothetical protein
LTACVSLSYSVEEYCRKYHGEMSAKLKGEVALAVHEREDSISRQAEEGEADLGLVPNPRVQLCWAEGAACGQRRRQEAGGPVSEHHLSVSDVCERCVSDV